MKYLSYWWIVIIGIATTAISLGNVAYQYIPNDKLIIAFLDVGQGDAVYIRTPSGNELLVDGGPDDSVIHQLSRVMRGFDTSLDMIIATHPDKDHIAGLVPVLKQFSVDYLLTTEKQSDTRFDVSLREQAQQEPSLQQIIATRGQRIYLDTRFGVYFDVLYPNHSMAQEKDTNDSSIIIRLVYGKISLLLTGDASTKIEDLLVMYDTQNLQSTLLKLGHHGSKTSTGEKFLNQVKPSIGIVSAGKNNTYGHPHPEVIKRFSNLAIPLVSTQDIGTIMYLTDGKNIWQH